MTKVIFRSPIALNGKKRPDKLLGDFQERYSRYSDQLETVIASRCDNQKTLVEVQLQLVYIWMEELQHIVIKTLCPPCFSHYISLTTLINQSRDYIIRFSQIQLKISLPAVCYMLDQGKLLKIMKNYKKMVILRCNAGF